MDNLTPQQKEELEKMVDNRIKDREQRRHKAGAYSGIKGKMGWSILILSMILQVSGVSHILINFPLFALAFVLIYADKKDALRKYDL